jgi:hypothetical protein
VLSGDETKDNLDHQKLDLLTNAVVNKVGQFMKDYGMAGFYTFLGSRQSLTNRDQPDGPTWDGKSGAYLNNWGFGGDTHTYGDDKEKYLNRVDRVYKEAQNQIDFAWSQIANWTKPISIGDNPPASDWGNDPPLPQEAGTVNLYTAQIMTKDDSGKDVMGIFYIHGQ